MKKFKVKYDYLYDSSRVKKPFNALITSSSARVRDSYGEICDSLHKAIILHKSGEIGVTGVRKLERMAMQLEKMIDVLEYDFRM